MPVTEEPKRASQARLESLDALRGFNMFWIIGGADLLGSIAEAARLGWLTAISNNLGEHVEWEGFHYHDMIFPLFLFIMGVTTPFSLGKRREQGATRGALVLHVLQRTAVLFLLGLVYSGLFKFAGFDHLRIMGVLQRLALASGCAALLYLFLDLRKQIAAAALLLLGYWVAMRWLPVPGHPVGTFTEEGNFANYVDRLIFLPGQLYKSYGDPEGLFSTIPAIVTALLGIFAGQWLRGPREPRQKAAGLFVAGAVCIALGYAWSPWFPVIKKVWTSSYTLVAGGWSAIILGAFYWIIDVRGAKRWAYFFAVIGLNPITIYLGQRIVDFGKIAEFFAGGAAQYAGTLAPIVLGVAVLTVKWLLLRFLYKQRIYLRV
jgi:predicted acyltransferase